MTFSSQAAACVDGTCGPVLLPHFLESCREGEHSELVLPPAGEGAPEKHVGL